MKIITKTSEEIEVRLEKGELIRVIGDEICFHVDRKFEDDFGGSQVYVCGKNLMVIS